MAYRRAYHTDTGEAGVQIEDVGNVPLVRAQRGKRLKSLNEVSGHIPNRIAAPSLIKTENARWKTYLAEAMLDTMVFIDFI